MFREMGLEIDLTNLLEEELWFLQWVELTAEHRQSIGGTNSADRRLRREARCGFPLYRSITSRLP
jgi:hypothetical protein